MSVHIAGSFPNQTVNVRSFPIPSSRHKVEGGRQASPGRFMR